MKSWQPQVQPTLPESLMYTDTADQGSSRWYGPRAGLWPLTQRARRHVYMQVEMIQGREKLKTSKTGP